MVTDAAQWARKGKRREEVEGEEKLDKAGGGDSANSAAEAYPNGTKDGEDYDRSIKGGRVDDAKG